MRETANLWRLWTLFKYGVAGFFLLMLCTVAFATERPPHNRPPDKGGTTSVEQSTAIDVGVSGTTTVGIRDGDVVQKAGSQETTQIVNIGGEGGAPLATTTVDGDNLSLDAGDSPTTVNTGGNKHESNFFALSTTFPNGHGCFGGAQGGGAGNGGGGWLGFHFLNWQCFSNYLAEQQKSVKARARLDCSAGDFRKAIAFDQPRKERHQYCVTFMETEYVGWLNFQRDQVIEALVAEQIELLEGSGSPK